MNRNRPLGRLALLGVVLCLSSGACATDEKRWDPVEFGAARPESTTLPVEVGLDDVLGAAGSPNACQFVTDDEIRALLPQAERIGREPVPVRVFSFDAAQRQRAPEGSCRYEFWLRNVTISDVRSGFTVSISGIADPSIVSDHYSEELASAARARSDREPAVDLGASLGPSACYTWRDSDRLFPVVVCRHGALMYEVSGTGYGDMVGVPDGDLVRQGEHWRDKVLAPVAQMIATKIPAFG